MILYEFTFFIEQYIQQVLKNRFVNPVGGMFSLSITILTPLSKLFLINKDIFSFDLFLSSSTQSMKHLRSSLNTIEFNHIIIVFARLINIEHTSWTRCAWGVAFWLSYRQLNTKRTQNYCQNCDLALGHLLSIKTEQELMQRNRWCPNLKLFFFEKNARCKTTEQQQKRNANIDLKQTVYIFW